MFEITRKNVASKLRILTKEQRIIAEKLINVVLYVGHSESKERFAIQRYLLIIGKKQNMQVLSHTFTYFST